MASSEAKRIRAQLFPSRTVPECSIEDWRAQELKARENDVLPAGVTVTPTRLAGVTGEWINHDPGEPKRTVLYLHGGGYVLGACATHRNLVSRVAKAANAQAFTPEYRLAPEYPFPTGVLDAFAVYDALLAAGVAPSSLAVMGDSAGGGLCAGLLLSLRDAGRPLPALAVLISPWTDLTLSGDSYRTRADLDPIDRVPPLRRMVQCYIGTGDRRAPLASPLFGDLRGLPPMLIQVGDHEVLLDDSVRFAEKATASGIEVQLEIWPEMWHVWHMALPALPEANEAIVHIGAYVQNRSRSP